MESMAVVIGIEGKVRQIALNVSEVNAVKDLISQLHGGPIKLLPGTIDTIEIEEIKNL